ncbi:MAG: hypothetical protein PHQ95_01260 [Candidatus Gracilibacteria bacterium]|nr:hypothetical protein [Candidatus Gracilibacteria bacterium]
MKTIPLCRYCLRIKSGDTIHSSITADAIDSGKEFDSITKLQSWIFRNPSLQKTMANDVQILFLAQIAGTEDLPVYADCFELHFASSLSFLDIATTENFLSCLEENSQNMMKKHYLAAADFLETKKSPSIIDLIVFLKNKVVGFLKDFRQLTPTHWVG